MAQSAGEAVPVAHGYRLVTFSTVGSTNREAMDRLKAGDPGRLWVFSPEQTAGKGRRGRAWATIRGNFAGSLALTVDAAPARAATLGFVAGLALRRALLRIVSTAAISLVLDGADALPADGQRSGGRGTGRIELKWPNDVVVDGAKLAGILLEAEPLSTGLLGVVIGIGVNVVSAPQDLPYPATSLADLGVRLEAELLLEALMEAWPDVYRVWSAPGGMEKIGREWLAGAAGVGGPVAVAVGGSVFRGRFETIDAEGRLMVVDDTGHRHAIAAGEVHFGVAAMARPEE
ncbi:MAG: biotin--[acetyl-CoA-carboxylase] ligase [Ancalomicrobiaceae bacterium]|nr:biotin--[acetyl-CoA-carboxylase] ligase [Ancalomicrobiaceae bacterium]